MKVARLVVTTNLCIALALNIISFILLPNLRQEMFANIGFILLMIALSQTGK